MVVIQNNNTNIVQLGYNYLKLCDSSSITTHILQYQLIPHNARVFLPCLVRHIRKRTSILEVKTLSVISSNIKLQTVCHFDNSTLSLSLRSLALYPFRQLHKFQTWKMKTVAVIQLRLMFPSTFLFLQLTGEWQSDNVATVMMKKRF